MDISEIVKGIKLTADETQNLVKNLKAVQDANEGRVKGLEDSLDKATKEQEAMAKQLADLKLAATTKDDKLADGGFKSVGEFAMAVKAAALGQRVDERLQSKASATTVAVESEGADGGYMVPAQYAEQLYQLLVDSDSVLGTLNPIPMTRGNSMSFKTTEANPWGGSGVIAYWRDELDAITQTRPRFKEVNLKLREVAALVPVTEELLDDAVALDAFIRTEGVRAINYKVDDAIISGDGVNKPLGILNAPCLVTVAKESSQSAAGVAVANIVKMFARMPAGSISRSRWLMNQNVLPQLLQLSVSNMPVFLPPTGLKDAPYGTLLGRPIQMCQSCKTMGTKGDIIFYDPDAYLTIVKRRSVDVATSMHLWFDQMLQAFRFVFRIDGRPWLSAPITPANGDDLSPFVTLATRP